MTNLSIFSFEGQEVRFVGTTDWPEWVANDIVAILYPQANRDSYRGYLAKVPGEWKGVKLINTPGGQQEATTLYEPGLYCLIARSESPIAVPFQKWVYEEVLPSIRKTGRYEVPHMHDYVPAPEQERNPRIWREKHSISASQLKVFCLL